MIATIFSLHGSIAGSDSFSSRRCVVKTISVPSRKGLATFTTSNVLNVNSGSSFGSC